jgi:hypothetical protein
MLIDGDLYPTLMTCEGGLADNHDVLGLTVRSGTELQTTREDLVSERMKMATKYVHACLSFFTPFTLTPFYPYPSYPYPSYPYPSYPYHSLSALAAAVTLHVRRHIVLDFITISRSSTIFAKTPTGVDDGTTNSEARRRDSRVRRANGTRYGRCRGGSCFSYIFHSMLLVLRASSPTPRALT